MQQETQVSLQFMEVPDVADKEALEVTVANVAMVVIVAGVELMLMMAIME